ncbi:MAG: hypothetical protein RL154_1409 [Pseudomonadota bacterium]|jgi:ribonuclease Y
MDAYKYDIFIEQAKSKAKAIEHEAELKLQNAKNAQKSLEIEYKERHEKDKNMMQRELHSQQSALERESYTLKTKLDNDTKNLAKEQEEIKNITASLRIEREYVDKIKKDYDAKLKESMSVLSKVSGLTLNEAKTYILDKAKELARADISAIVRKAEAEAKAEAQRKANFIIAQATTRYAGEFTAERLINVINIPSDEIKGRIIGKDGRNIKTLETLLGVDIIIDDTPGAIIISSFNILRRAIAAKTLDLLIADGRIQPAKIEEIFEKVKNEFDAQIQQEGEDIVNDLGVGVVHPEIIKLIGRLRYRASYGQNALAHTLEVAHLASIMAAELGGDPKIAKRAGLLHDIGKALTHDYAGSHVDLGAEICKRYKEDPIILNAIYAHHGYAEIGSVECAAVCAADSLSAGRPGARREALESFLKRVQELEKIATSKKGVKSAYAIAAGKEVRIIVSAELVSDDEASLIAREVSEEIEDGMQYPGEIKVNVIRESRYIEYAR